MAKRLRAFENPGTEGIIRQQIKMKARTFRFRFVRQANDWLLCIKFNFIRFTRRKYPCKKSEYYDREVAADGVPEPMIQ